jgi:hypothetical protein
MKKQNTVVQNLSSSSLNPADPVLTAAVCQGEGDLLVVVDDDDRGVTIRANLRLRRH